MPNSKKQTTPMHDFDPEGIIEYGLNDLKGLAYAMEATGRHVSEIGMPYDDDMVNDAFRVLGHTAQDLIDKIYTELFEKDTASNA